MSRIIRILGITCVVLVLSAAGRSAEPGGEASLIRELQEIGAGNVRLSVDSKTGITRFIGTDSRSGVFLQDASPGGDAQVASRSFLSTYGKLFGLKDQERQLKVEKIKKAGKGREFVRFRQERQGIPVYGGEIIVQTAGSGKRFISANGKIAPDITVDGAPRLAPDAAAKIALKAVSKHRGIPAGSLRVGEPKLWIYDPKLVGINNDLVSLAWRVEVTHKGKRPLRELVLVDAHLGAILLEFDQVDHALDRSIYTANGETTLPGTPVRLEGETASGDPDVDNAYDFLSDTHLFYLNNHGLDIADRIGKPLTASVHYFSGLVCPDAFWNGSQLVFCDGMVVDDLLAHELTHAVTEKESGLFKLSQSGAINEAFSDIWGEFVDQTNGRGNDDASVKWLLGEDSIKGPVRSMSNPNLYEQPDRMGDTDFYYCGSGDYGGVHTNSGVANKAAYLMTEGGSFNGYEVSALGIEKVADLFFEVQSNLLTSAADYRDLHDALIQAAVNLDFSEADRLQVLNAVEATEMAMQPSGCAAAEPPPPECDSGNIAELFSDDFEDPMSGKWERIPDVVNGVDEWYYPPVNDETGFNATYARSGTMNLWGNAWHNVGDYSMATSQSIALPESGPISILMYFSHSYNFEAGASVNDGYDGGVVEYSVDDGQSWIDAGSLFTHNGYSRILSDKYLNPLGGREAFSGYSNGYITSRLRLDLPDPAGQSVRFRFRIGTDDSTGSLGWFIDDVFIHVCGLPIVTVSSAVSSISESAGETGEFTVTRTGSAAEALTVNFSVGGGDATEGEDYEALARTVTIEAGKSSANISLIPRNDTLIEGPETVTLTLVPGAGYILGGAASAEITITDDEKPTVWIELVPGAASEAGPDPGKFRVHIDPVTIPVTVYYTVAYTVGSDAGGADHNLGSPGSVTIEAGQSSVDIELTPVDDDLVEGPETVALSLAPDAGYILGVPISAEITIADDEKPTVWIELRDGVASEAGPDPGKFRVHIDPVTVPVTVDYTVAYTVGNDAGGADHDLGSPGSVTIEAGQSSVDIELTPVDDDFVEGPETVVIAIVESLAAYEIDPDRKTVTIRIRDNDKPIVGITVEDAVASEPGIDKGAFRVSVDQCPPQPLKVFYSVDGSATPVDDYAGLPYLDASRTSGFVWIPAKDPVGESEPTTCSSSIIVWPKDDAIVEPVETVEVILSGSPTGAYELEPDPAKTRATVTINENDKPIVSIEATDGDASELGPDTGTFKISFDQCAPKGIRVFYAVGGSATPVADYTGLTNLDASGKTGSIMINSGPTGGTSCDKTITIKPVVDGVGGEGVERAKISIITTPDGAYKKHPTKFISSVLIHDND